MFFLVLSAYSISKIAKRLGNKTDRTEDNYKHAVMELSTHNKHNKALAELEDSTYVEEEFNVRAVGKSPIKNVFLKSNDVPPFSEAVEEILKADIIVIGPGSLYTSLITNLLVTGIRNAIRNSKATKIYVCNIVTQPGQTDHNKVSDHIKAVTKYLGDGVLDYVIVNNNIPRKDILDKYQKEGAAVVLMDEGVYSLNVNVKKADLVEDLNQKRVLWVKGGPVPTRPR